MPSCFVVGCKSGYNGSKSHLFKIPIGAGQSLISDWIKNLPKREILFNFQKHLVCHLHFESEYLITRNYIIQSGKKVDYEERKKWKLTDNAVPTKFANEVLSNNYNKHNNKRKSPVKRSGHNTKRVKMIETFSIDQLSSILPQILLPSPNWSLKYEEDVNIKRVAAYELLKTSGTTMLINRSLIVDSEMMVTVSWRGKPINVFPILKVSVQKDLEDALVLLHKLQVCCGVKGFNQSSVVKDAEQFGATWYSSNCTITRRGEAQMCEHCVKLRNKLRVEASRRKNIQCQDSYSHRKNTTRKTLMQLLQNKSRQLSSTQRRHAKNSLQLKYMNKKFKSLSDVRLEETINNSQLPENMKLQMLQAARLAKSKTKKGLRYQQEWLLQCLLLKIKTNSGYRFLRDRNILPLPHPSTLQRLIRGIPCQFGFSEFIFSGLKEEFFKRNIQERQCIVSFDEIKIRESLDFDRANLQMNGFVNFGDFVTDPLSCGKNRKKKLAENNIYADHALVFMLRTLNSKLVQPIGAFASRGAAPGAILAKLLVACLLKVEETGLNVIGVSCDGATTNKSMWKEFGISGTQGATINSIQHPCDSEGTRRLYFISDVPHIFKCIRNNMMKKKTVMYNNKQLNYNLYQAVLDEDLKLPCGIRVIPKVTQSHISPSPFQKMRVCLATQLFSNSMAAGIKFYREKRVHSLQLSQPTEMFTKDMNDLFDALNTSNTSNKLRMQDSKYLCIQAFSEMLQDSTIKNTFASDVTLESMRVTLMSIIDLVDYLITVCKYDYVLTAKFNQDCLERFFGVLRQIGGDEDHPTATTFLQLYRLLSIYFPTARLLRSNVNSTEDVNPTKIYCKNLSKIRHATRDSIKAKRKEMDSDIMQKILICTQQENQSTSHSPSVSDCVVYNLCGYLVFKSTKFTTCQQCLFSLEARDEMTKEKQKSLSLLTDLKSLGGLKHPSPALTKFITDFVEPSICKVLANTQNAFDISDIVHQLPVSMMCNIGCQLNGHVDSLVPSLVHFYISIRLFFFCRNRNQQNIRPKNTKQNRKAAKLT